MSIPLLRGVVFAHDLRISIACMRVRRSTFPSTIQKSKLVFFVHLISAITTLALQLMFLREMALPNTRTRRQRMTLAHADHPLMLSRPAETSSLTRLDADSTLMATVRRRSTSWAWTIIASWHAPPLRPSLLWLFATWRDWPCSESSKYTQFTT